MLLWTDLETTGLDPNRDLILEMGFLLTHDDGEEIDAFSIPVWHPDMGFIMEHMAPNVLDMHTTSGLLAEIGQHGMELTLAINSVIARLRPFINPLEGDGCPPLCGSTVNFDRNFLRGYCPQILDYCHYRSIDVSSMKETYRRWGGRFASMVDKWEMANPKSKAPHRSIADLRLSLGEWLYYRDASQ